MSNRTHRWKSRFAMTQVTNKPNKSNRYSSKNCEINVKFENSNYFSGTSAPYKFIFDKKDVQVPINTLSNSKSTPNISHYNKPFKVTNVDSSGRILDVTWSEKNKTNFETNPSDKDSMYKSDAYISIFTNDPQSPYKLQANEYVEADCVENLVKLTDPLVRCYFISPIQKNISYIIHEIERIKKLFFGKDWESFRLFILVEGYDICENILTHSSIDESKESAEFKEPPRTSSEFNNEEEEELMRELSCNPKFRDSRYIKSSTQVTKISSHDGINWKDISNALKKIAKTFDHGVEHSLKIANDLKMEIEEILFSMEEPTVVDNSNW